MVLFALIASVAVFLRADLLSGFHAIFGDAIDARIEITLLEHWYNVLRGMEPWRDPVFLIPAKGVLGYNDGYFLYGLIYSGFRAVGLDPFLAAEFVHASVRAIGFAGFLGFATRVARLPFGWSLLGAAVFTVSNAATMQVRHAQLLSVGFAPVLGWLVAEAWRGLRRQDVLAAACWGCAAAALFDAWLMTAFYMLWFGVLFTALAVVAAGPVLRWRACLTIPRWPAAMAGALAAAGAIPFVLTYWPAARATGMHPFADVAMFAPAPLDLVNVGSGNILFGPVNVWLNAAVRPGAALDGENAVGFPWLMLALSLAGAVTAWASRPATDRLFWRAVGAAFALSLVLCVVVNGYTLWRFVYWAVPGGPAVRVISRYVLFLGFPATLLGVYALSRRRWTPVLAIAVSTLLLVEEINTTPQSALSRRDELAFLTAIPPAPAACQAFAVVQPREAAVDPFLQPLMPNTDGMLLAEWLHVPALNGHASFLPARFGLKFGAGPDFHDRVQRAVSDAGLGLTTCGLDLAQRRWEGPPIIAAPPPLLEPGITVQVGGTDAAVGYLTRGWSGAEPKGRWTEGTRAELAFTIAECPTGPLRIDLAGSGLSLGGPPSHLTVIANRVTVAEWAPSGRDESFSATIPPMAAGKPGIVVLQLNIAAPRRPRDVSKSLDDRELGLFVHSFRVTAAS